MNVPYLHKLFPKKYMCTKNKRIKKIKLETNKERGETCLLISNLCLS